MRLGDNYFDRQLSMGSSSLRLGNDSVINSTVGKHVSELETGLQALTEKEFEVSQV